jgi:hypothetical protein
MFKLYVLPFRGAAWMVFAFVFLFASCRKDQDATETVSPQPDPLVLQAQQWYAVQDIGSNSLLNHSGPNGRVKTRIEPLWEKAETKTDGAGKPFLLVPVKSDPKYALTTVGFRNLLIRQNPQGQTEAFTVEVIGQIEYLKRKHHKIDMADFTGEIIWYRISDGSVYAIGKARDGKMQEFGQVSTPAGGHANGRVQGTVICLTYIEEGAEGAGAGTYYENSGPDTYSLYEVCYALGGGYSSGSDPATNPNWYPDLSTYYNELLNGGTFNGGGGGGSGPGGGPACLDCHSPDNPQWEVDNSEAVAHEQFPIIMSALGISSLLDLKAMPYVTGNGSSLTLRQKVARQYQILLYLFPSHSPEKLLMAAYNNAFSSTLQHSTLIIDDSGLKPCFQAVLNDVKKLDNGAVSGIIQRFTGATPNYNWKVKNSSLDDNVNGATSEVYYVPSNTALTTFDNNKFKQASDLAIARTILHEAVHAYLVAYFTLNPAQRNPLNSNFALNPYPDYVRNILFTNIGNNEAQHIEMTKTFVDDIATALEQYGYYKGYLFSHQFYNDLAWGGLTDTPAFTSKPDAEQNRIRDVIQIEQYKQDRLGNPKTPKGQPSGC